MKKLLGPKNWRVTLSLLIALVCVSALALLLATSQPTSAAQMLAPQADVIATYDFDDGTTQGWGGRGAVVIATTEAARSGTHSIKVTGRTEGWNSASINALGLLEVGASYMISGCTRLVAGQPITNIQTNIAFVQVTSSGTSYPWIATTAADGVTADGWTCAQGVYTYTEEATELTLYVESPNSATAEYYVDDIAIVMTTPPPGVYRYNFDDGTTQGWGGRGAVVTATTEAARSGTHSIKVTGRTEGWNSASINALGLLEVGASYMISGCTRLVAGQPITNIQTNIAFVQVTSSGTSYPWIATTAADGVTADGWTCAQGVYTYTEEATELTLYVESPNSATAEYYVDDIAIVMISAPPVGPVEEIARYDFDDDTLQGWAGRPSPTVTVAVVSETFRSAPNSLKVTGRTDNIHGAQIDLTSVLQPNVTYEISGCVRLVEGQPGDRLVFTMQRNPAGVITPTYTWIVQPVQVTTTAWTCINAQYTFADADQLILYVESREGPTTEFYVDDVVILRPTQSPIQRDIPSLYEELSPHFLVGSAIEPNQLDSIRHTELLTRHFNSLTAENAMKPESIQPTEGTFNWAGADRLAQFARDHDMAVHGHTLQWHEQVPDWFFQVNGEPMTPTLENKQLLLDRLETHIRAVAERYKDVVNVWDVVNEVIDQSQPDCLRRSPWYEITGRDYISLAFTVANEVAPTATLILNDYGTTEPLKRQCIYRVVDELLDAGIPVEGIGMQKHINIQNPTPAAIEETIEMFASLGVEVHITELDMSIYTSDSTAYATAADVPEEVLVAQGYRYKELFEVFKRQAAHIGSVTFWGLSDDHTWLTNRPIPRVDMPMPFDQQQQAKHAYWGIIDPSRLPVFIQQMDVAQGTPTLDGDAEFLWDMLPWKEVQPATEEFTATFQTRWDASHLYLFLDVTDLARSTGGTAHLLDAIDVFIDEGNDKAGAYGADDWHYRFQGGAYIPVVPFGAPQFEIVTSTTGYRLEAAFPLSGTAAIGDMIGFDVRLVNGSYPSAYVSWNDLQHTQNISTTNWGSLTLVGEYKSTTALQGTPVIDALEDALWADAAEVSTNVWVAGTSGSTARVKTMWDDAHLYIYAVVSDSLLSDASSNAWEQDSIEAFVDQNNSKVTTYEDDDGQFRVNFNNVQSFRGAAASADTLDSATRILTGTGYVVEMAIALNDFPPQLNGLIGFDFQVNNDQDGDGDRDSIAMWNDPTGQSYQNTSRLGVLQFVARTVTAPVADFSATPTSGDAPLAVTFTDLSTNDPATWQWAFGDGGTSTLQNPVHTYDTPGVYTVTLTAGNTAGSDTEIKTSYITVAQPVYRLYLPLAMKNS